MRQKHTMQWLSAVTGRAKGLVGLLVVLLLEIIEGMLYYFFTRMILKKRLNLD